MFTGIVEDMGTVARMLRRSGAIRMEINAPARVMEGIKIGDSVAVNGACVTVTESQDGLFATDLVPETLGRTNLGTLQPGEEVNLERPLRADSRLDGHIVQGHIDVVGLVRSRRRVGAQELLEVNVPYEITRYLAPKGSVALDGVSLTVVDVNKDRFRVALIPHTIDSTTLGKKIQGQAVNVEVDVLSKYVERHIAARMPVKVPSIQSLVAQHDAEHRATAAEHTAPVPAPRAEKMTPPVMRTVPSAPRSVPFARPAPPPRQQPPRFTAPPGMKPPAAPSTKAAAPKAKPASKPAPKANQHAPKKPPVKATKPQQKKVVKASKTSVKARKTSATRHATKKVRRAPAPKRKR